MVDKLITIAYNLLNVQKELSVKFSKKYSLLLMDFLSLVILAL